VCPCVDTRGDTDGCGWTDQKYLVEHQSVFEGRRTLGWLSKAYTGLRNMEERV